MVHLKAQEKLRESLAAILWQTVSVRASHSAMVCFGAWLQCWPTTLRAKTRSVTYREDGNGGTDSHWKWSNRRWLPFDIRTTVCCNCTPSAMISLICDGTFTFYLTATVHMHWIASRVLAVGHRPTHWQWVTAAPREGQYTWQREETSLAGHLPNPLYRTDWKEYNLSIFIIMVASSWLHLEYKFWPLPFTFC